MLPTVKDSKSESQSCSSEHVSAAFSMPCQTQKEHDLVHSSRLLKPGVQEPLDWVNLERKNQVAW